MFGKKSQKDRHVGDYYTEDNIVPVVYEVGTYGSKLINFINLHDEFFTTLPDKLNGRVEGGAWYLPEVKTVYLDDRLKKRCHTRKRIAAKLVPHSSYCDGFAETIKANLFFRKMVIVSIDDSDTYESAVMLRDKKVLCNVAGYESYPDDMDSLKEEARKQIYSIVTNNRKLCRANNDIFQIKFSTIDDISAWYEDLCKYLGIAMLEDPKYYWNNL
ncbi:MAG: hypothetical protein ACR2MS_06040 [Weeksellaceae bacterium]